jgi:hypothetical protein
MALSNKIQVTDLEFDDIKSNLKTYLGSQSQFQDYNFEGSGMSVLIDILAYNTHYMGYYANMLGNEMFLDSASLRESVVSHAKTMGITPTSAKPATAKLDFVFTPGSLPASLTIEKNTQFISKINGIKYKFVTTKTTTIPRSISDTYSITGVEIREGKILTRSYTVDASNTIQRFIIPNADVDLDTLIVNIQASASNSKVDTFTNGNNIDVTTVKSTDKVFWVHEIENSQYELSFGDGAVGKQLSDGNIIFIEYLTTTGSTANGANVFSANTTVAGLNPSQYIMSTSAAAIGGSDIQSIGSLKYLTPKLYSAQKRACTADDYKSILLEQRPDIESITTYGGEDADPVQYGKVFIALKPVGNTVFSDIAKAAIIKDVLKQTNVVTVMPVIVDPTFFYLQFEVTVNYDPITNLTDEVTLKSNINASIQNYLQTNLEKFDQKFRYSQLTGSIDNTNQAIRNSKTIVKYAQRIYPATFGVPATYTINFNNPILQGYFKSTQFVASDGQTYQLVDDTVGNVKLVRLPTGTLSGATWVNDYSSGQVHRVDETGTLHTGHFHYDQAVHDSSSELLEQMILPDGTTNIGTIDYDTGQIKLVNFAPMSITSGDSYIKLSVHPQLTTSDVTPLREQILTYDVNDSESINITMVSEII